MAFDRLMLPITHDGAVAPTLDRAQQWLREETAR
jgi:hypothetical protein